jgi:nickel-type superoxide dismutase maturation protease
MVKKAGIGEILGWLTGRRKIFRVEGASMSPALKDGELVLIDRTVLPNAGDIVLADHPYKKSVKILKRLTAFTDNGEMILSGDNPHESTDSRTFGSVPRSNFIGVVTSRLKKL